VIVNYPNVWKTEQGLIQFCNALNLPNMQIGVLDKRFAQALIQASSLGAIV
jgi:hypothetical protein